MNILTHNQVEIPIAGMRIVGYLSATFSQLRTAFGTPSYEPNQREQTYEWRLRFEGGSTAMVYDWWSEGPPKDWTAHDVIQWHICGHSREVVQLVHDAFREKLDLTARSAA